MFKLFVIKKQINLQSDTHASSLSSLFPVLETCAWLCSRQDGFVCVW